MDYKKSEAKEYAREHLMGVWAANLTPFDDALCIDEKAYRENLDHWIKDLQLGGLFIAGKQAEFFSMSIPERKRLMEMSVDTAQAAGDRGRHRPLRHHHLVLGHQPGCRAGACQAFAKHRR